MHYRPLSFNKNESIPTITTTIPYFNEVIGQRLDFSAVDITRLNRMYDCGEYHLHVSKVRQRLLGHVLFETHKEFKHSFQV